MRLHVRMSGLAGIMHRVVCFVLWEKTGKSPANFQLLRVFPEPTP